MRGAFNILGRCTGEHGSILPRGIGRFLHGLSFLLLYNEFPASPASYLVVFAGFFVDDPSCSLYKPFAASPAKAVGLVQNEKHLQNFDLVMTSIRNSYQYTIILLKWYLSNCHNDTDIKLPISEIGGIPYIGQYGDVWTIWVGFFAPKSARGFNRIYKKLSRKCSFTFFPALSCLFSTWTIV